LQNFTGQPISQSAFNHPKSLEAPMISFASQTNCRKAKVQVDILRDEVSLDIGIHFASNTSGNYD
jgi:hypothetical protein